MNIFEQEVEEQRTAESIYRMLQRRGWAIRRSRNWFTGRVRWRCSKQGRTTQVGFQVNWDSAQGAAQAALEVCTRLDQIFDQPAPPATPPPGT